MYDFSQITTWFDMLLRVAWGWPDWVATTVECVIVGIVVLVAYALLAIVMIYMERKVCAFFQCRLGPVRVGFWGLLQVPCDVLKMLIKEIFWVDRADKLLYCLAPMLVIVGSVGAFSFLPWNKGAIVLDFDCSIFLYTAVSALGVLGVFLAGWASNNKYSVVSAMRAAVQMISYEISLALCLIAACILVGSMQISQIIDAQQGAFGWLLFQGNIPAIIAFLVFLVAGNAEANRGPFDLAEAESELTAGYHVEYSGLAFGFYYLAEFLNLFIIAGIAATVFLGGWMPLHIGIAGFDRVMDYIPGIVWFLLKAFLLVWLLMWVKWTFPRLRIDQILALEWKYLMPIALVNIILMTTFVALGFVGHLYVSLLVVVAAVVLAVVVAARALAKARRAKEEQRLVIQ